MNNIMIFGAIAAAIWAILGVKLINDQANVVKAYEKKFGAKLKKTNNPVASVFDLFLQQNKILSGKFENEPELRHLVKIIQYDLVAMLLVGIALIISFFVIDFQARKYVERKSI